MEHANTALAPMVPLASYPKYRLVSSLKTYAPLATAQKQFCWLSGGGMRNGIRVVAGPGTGKSRLLARGIAWPVFARGEPIVIIDPIGATIDNLLDKIVRLPRSSAEKLWPRVLYVDPGASDYLVPTQLYYRLSDDDTLFEIANRFPAILKRQDPDLVSAPILGWNAAHECAIHAGMIAAALGRQVDFVADLVLHPGSYKEALKQALASDPALLPAVTYFRELMDPTRHSLREKRTGSFQTKLLPLVADRRLLAAFGGASGGIDWERCSREGRLVLIDLRQVLDPDIRQLMMLWYFKQFTDFIKQRGVAGRANPILFVVDEITQLLAHRSSSGNPLLAEDLEELIAVLARNCGVNVVISHQNLSQVDERIRNVLIQMGTQIIGKVANPEDAQALADFLLTYNPYRVKTWEPIWMTGGLGPKIVDERPVFFTLEEQRRMVADRIKALDRFQFLVSRPQGEGSKAMGVALVSCQHLDQGMYPHPEYLAAIRTLLRQRCGVPVAELLDEIDRRRKQLPAIETAPKQPEPMKRKKDERKAGSVNGKIAGSPAHAGRNHSVPAAAKSPTIPPAPDPLPLAPTADNEVRTDEDDVWQ